MLCTRQYNCHCVRTFARPLSVKRFSRLLCLMLANTGSTVAMRWLYSRRPGVESIAAFITSMAESWVGSRFTNNATCRTSVRSGVRRHRPRKPHGTQLLLAPVNLDAPGL